MKSSSRQEVEKSDYPSSLEVECAVKNKKQNSIGKHSAFMLANIFY